MEHAWSKGQLQLHESSQISLIAMANTIAYLFIYYWVCHDSWHSGCKVYVIRLWGINLIGVLAATHVLPSSWQVRLKSEALKYRIAAHQRTCHG